MMLIGKHVNVSVCMCSHECLQDVTMCMYAVVAFL